MRVDAADAAEAVARELAVHAGDHLAEGGVALGLEQGIDVVGVGGPRPFDVPGPTVGVGLVPHGQVGVDGGGDVAHQFSSFGQGRSVRARAWRNDVPPAITWHVSDRQNRRG